MVAKAKAKDDRCRLTLSFKPKGSQGGSDWDDGAIFSTVQAIKIYLGGKSIDVIQFVYEDQNGNLIFPRKHGGNYFKNIIEVGLETPKEYVISVHGYYGDIYDPFGNPTNVIRSLTFETNQRTLGPYGIEEGPKFSFPTTGPIKIVGFHGRSGWFLDSIGFHFLPISISNYRDKREKALKPITLDFHLHMFNAIYYLL